MSLPTICSDFRAVDVARVRQVSKAAGGLATVMTVRLAASNRYYDAATNEWKERGKLFIDAEYWGDDVPLISSRIEKGTSLFVAGELRIEEWEKDGEKRSKVFIRARKIRPLASMPSFNGSPAGAGQATAPVAPSNNDEPPF